MRERLFGWSKNLKINGIPIGKIHLLIIIILSNLFFYLIFFTGEDQVIEKTPLPLSSKHIYVDIPLVVAFPFKERMKVSLIDHQNNLIIEQAKLIKKNDTSEDLEENHNYRVVIPKYKVKKVLAYHINAPLRAIPYHQTKEDNYEIIF